MPCSCDSFFEHGGCSTGLCVSYRLPALTSHLGPHSQPPRSSLRCRCDLVQGDEGAAVLQFHAWDDGFKVGPELPEPFILVWDQSLTFAALAYSSQVRSREVGTHLCGRYATNPELHHLQWPCLLLNAACAAHKCTRVIQGFAPNSTCSS